jgi:hypothetical protein
MIVKTDEKGNFENKPTLGVRYVDLTSRDKQCPGLYTDQKNPENQK